MRRMKGNAGNSPLGGFRRRVLPVADHRVADRGELDADLILQSGQQSDADERGGNERAFDGVTKLRARRSGIALGA